MAVKNKKVVHTSYALYSMSLETTRFVWKNNSIGLLTGKPKIVTKINATIVFIELFFLCGV